MWQNLTHHTIIFGLVTLTLKFDLLFKNFKEEGFQCSVESSDYYLDVLYTVALPGLAFASVEYIPR